MTTPDGPPRQRAAYSHWTRLALRYGDLDTLGHVNHAAVAVLLEQVRCELIYPLIKEKGPHGALDMVVARLVIDYLAELSWPGAVEIGTRVGRLGNRSFRLDHAMFDAGAVSPGAVAEITLVCFDLEARRSAPPPPRLRAALEALMPGAS
jgi:acyl-CoA thioester hydrolase